jgi:hypothetical protein
LHDCTSISVLVELCPPLSAGSVGGGQCVDLFQSNLLSLDVAVGPVTEEEYQSREERYDTQLKS